jgi:hypothetical protein
MYRRTAQFILLAAAVFAVVSLGVLAQDATTPDLAGTWVLNPTKSKVPKKVALDPETLVIKCPGNSIEIATSSGRKQSLEMFVVDGKEHSKDTGSGGQIYSKAQWKKGVLFTETGGRVTGNGIGAIDILTFKERWSVSPDGLVLTRHIEDPKKTLVYDKRPAQSAP